MGKARSQTLRVRLSMSEWTKLERYAEAHGMDKSKVIRKYIGKLPWKVEKVESNDNYQEET